MFPKFRYVRDVRILRACREMPCMACGTKDGTVVAAHSNQSKHGKGRGIKASDEFVAALCFCCHGWLDQGDGSREEKNAMWDEAHRLTRMILQKDGLLPTD